MANGCSSHNYLYMQRYGSVLHENMDFLIFLYNSKSETEGTNHTTLFKVKFQKDGKCIITLYDSLATALSKEAKKIMECLENLIRHIHEFETSKGFARPPTIQFQQKIAKVPQQDNSFDCGVYTMWYVYKHTNNML
jgi:Ulp1 family protease